MQLKYSNYAAFSHVHGVAVNNSGLSSLISSSVRLMIYFLGLAIMNHRRFFILYIRTAVITNYIYLNINRSVH